MKSTPRMPTPSRTAKATCLLSAIACAIAGPAQAGRVLVRRGAENHMVEGEEFDALLAARPSGEYELQAVAGAGEIRLRCGVVGESGELVIEDTGPGFDEETRARLFEPFFSTKTQGSGLGLALVRKVAEDLGGSASLERDGAVTRATFRLPLARD